MFLFEAEDPIWFIQVYKLNKRYSEPVQLQAYDVYIVKYV